MKRTIFQALLLFVAAGYGLTASASNWDAHWPFNEDGANSLGSLHQGQFPNSGTGSFDNGRLGSGLYYDLMQVDSLSIQRVAEPMSVSLWALRENTNFAEFLMGKQAGENQPGFSIGFNDANNIAFNITGENGRGIRVVSDMAWDDLSDWHHLVVTYDGSGRAEGVKFFFDGQPVSVQVESDSLSGAIDSNAPLIIGGRSLGSEVFSGSIDEVQINSWALDRNQVSCLFRLEENCAVPPVEEDPEVGLPGFPGFKGPPGPKGLQGPAGDSGAVGAVGPRGPEGPQGAQGEPGPRGDTGPKGERGLAGEPGEDGRDGRRGPDGRTGVKGIPGPDGDPGTEVGPSGPKGPKGETGDAGPEGARGPDGEKGDRGDRGDAGPTGPAGEQGPQGAKGVDGLQGSQGAKGKRGEEGYPGPAGDLRGIPGEKGLRGDPGDKGDRGDPGPAGYTGPSGENRIIWIRQHGCNPQCP